MPGEEVMHATALLLLRDNATVQQLVVAWPNVKQHRLTEKMVQSWAQVAGVPEYEVYTWMPMLVSNGICLKDGTVDPLAMGYLTRLAMARVPKEFLPKSDKPKDKPAKEGG